MLNRVATCAGRCALVSNMIYLREDNLMQGSQPYILLGKTFVGRSLLKSGVHVAGN
jgi:hypothetical protein